MHGGSGQRAAAAVHADRGRRAIAIPVPFDGAPFSQYQQIGAVDPAFAGGRFSARFTVPQRVFDQLAARRKAWPIPWTAEDYRTTWLAPERLLLFVQIAEPDPTWEARLTIDGRTVELRKAYSAVRTAPRTFVGFYADLSLIAADREHTLELELPRLRPGQLQGVFFENVETEYTDSDQEVGSSRQLVSGHGCPAGSGSTRCCLTRSAAYCLLPTASCTEVLMSHHPVLSEIEPDARLEVAESFARVVVQLLRGHS